MRQAREGVDVRPHPHIGLGTAPDGPVSPDAWIVVVRCDGRWLVIYEICSASAWGTKS